jgi:ornithine cyclodeaminase
MRHPELLFDPLGEEILWLNEAHVQLVLDPATAYEAVAAALTCHARGDYVQPLKPYVRPCGREGEYRGGRFIAMPAYVGPPVAVAGIKWIAGFPANLERNLPRASGTIVLNCIETGRPFAVMECATVSARRTAAVAALAVDHLAPPGPRRVALLGAGPIAKAVVEALAHHKRGIDRVTVFDPQAERLNAFVAAGRREQELNFEAAADVRQCVRGANVIITATTGARAYLQKDWVAPGGLIVPLSLDDCTPELFLSADKVLVDDFDQCNQEEKLLHRLTQANRFSREQVYAELGEVIAGIKPGRERDGERIYLNLMGMAIEDLAAAKAAYDRAVQRGLAHVLPRSALSSAGDWKPCATSDHGFCS